MRTATVFVRQCYTRRCQVAYIHEKPCELVLRNNYTLLAAVRGHVCTQLHADILRLIRHEQAE